MTWPTVKLGDVCKFTNGGTPSKDVTDFWCGEIPWISSADIVNDAIQQPRNFITAAAVNNSSTNQVPAGTLLVVTRTGVGKVAITEVDLCFSQDITALHLNANCFSKYIAYAIKSHSSSLIAQARGATIKGITRDVLASLPIPLPPLAEQQRIAAILDKAEDIKRKREQAIEKLDQLAQSTFESYGNKGDLKRYRLDEVADFYAGNSLPEGVEYKKQEHGFFLMKVSDMNAEGNEKYIYQCKEWSSNKGSNSGTCPSGSIVIPKRGGAIGTNKKRITTRSTILDPNLMAIKARENLINSDFLMQWFLRFDLGSITSGSSVPQLNKKDLAPLEIFAPSLQVQNEFGALLKKIDLYRHELTRSLMHVVTLQNSLQHQAFTTGFRA